MRQKRQRQEAGGPESRGEQVEGARAIRMFIQPERKEGGETDGRKRWPCLLPIRAIMSDDEGETEGGRGAERMRRRGEGRDIEVKEMEG